MSELSRELQTLIEAHTPDKRHVINDIINLAQQNQYSVVDVDDNRPWGGFIRFEYADADDFIAEFFPGLNPHEARLGNDELELSPKILLVSPRQRLSWQVHERRAERWKFLTDGGYYKSTDADNPGELIEATAGDEVQFSAGECHRLVGAQDDYTIVAEIWQHTDANHPSDEDDITRLADDYKR